MNESIAPVRYLRSACFLVPLLCSAWSGSAFAVLQNAVFSKTLEPKLIYTRCELIRNPDGTNAFRTLWARDRYVFGQRMADLGPLIAQILAADDVECGAAQNPPQAGLTYQYRCTSPTARMIYDESSWLFRRSNLAYYYSDPQYCWFQRSDFQQTWGTEGFSTGIGLYGIGEQLPTQQEADALGIPALGHASTRRVWCKQGYRWSSDQTTCVPGADPEKNTGDCDEAGGQGLTGHPVNPASGNKFLHEFDFQLPRGSRGLSFERYYNSHYADTALMFPLGGWKHSFQFQLTAMMDDAAVVIDRPDTGRISFELQGSSYVGAGDARTRLVRSADGQGNTISWTHFTADGWIETYNASGEITTRAQASGYTQSFVYQDFPYNDGVRRRLASVSDSFGRSLAFTYKPLTYGELTSVADSNGAVVSFSKVGADLVVTYPGSSTRRYTYATTPSPSTQYIRRVTDELANVYTEYTYVTLATGDVGVATSSFAGGIGNFTFTYDSPFFQTTVVDPLGASRVHNYATNNGSARLVSQSQPAGAGCAASTLSQSYDANGNIAHTTRFDGTKVCKAFDSQRNLETARIEGLPAAATCSSFLNATTLSLSHRKVSTQWHPDWRVQIRRAEPKKITTWVYNGQPDPHNGNAISSCAPVGAVLPDGKPIVVLCKLIEQATTDETGAQGFAATITGNPRVTSATYDSWGQVLTSTDAMGHSQSYNYYTTTSADYTVGDLQSVTNAAGHTAQYLRYDRVGRLLRAVDPNGMMTEYSYAPRGWLTSIQVTPVGGGSPMLTTLGRDDAGQLRTLTQPDGTNLTFTYDAAHRLTGIVDGAGNSVTYVLDGMGNRVTEQRKDPSGVLARSITRTYDALNRLQGITGARE